MGINKQALSIILNEHRYRPITGRYLNISKQTVSITPESLRALFDDYAIDRSQLDQLIDTETFDEMTRAALRDGITAIHDHDLLSCFSNAEYNSSDRSDYEGASVILDMNEAVSDQYHNQFDFIYTGGTGDNVFDPVTLIRNTAKMLKAGGRIVHMEVAAGYPGAYLMFSPEWLYSYYALNGFIDCKAYLFVSRNSSDNRYFFNTDLFEWAPEFTRDPDYDYVEACKSIDGMMFVLVVAEKGENSTTDKTPIQMQYIDDESVDWRMRHHDFVKTLRPRPLTNKQFKDVALPYLSDHHTYLGSEF